MILAVVAIVMLWGCNSRPQANGYVSELTSADSLSIKMGQFTLLKYHSDRLGFNINYPSYLVHQDLPDEVGMQELFMMDDVSISVLVDSLAGMMRSSGQRMMGGCSDRTERVGEKLRGTIKNKSLASARDLLYLQGILSTRF